MMRRAGLILGLLILATPAVGHVGTGLSVNRHGDICFTDTIHNRVVRVSSLGLTEVVARDVHSNVVACSDDGSIYFASGDSIWMRSRAGEVRKLFEASMLRKGLGEPFAIDPHGNSYFASESEVVRITRDGFVSPWARVRSDSPLSGGTFSNDETLYAKNGDAIVRIAREGSLTVLANGRVAGVKGRLDSPVWRQRTLGLGADARGNVFVASHRFGRLYRINAKGEVGVLHDSSFPWVPVAVATRGRDVFFLERPGAPYGPSFVLGKRMGRHRIWRIDAGGKKTIVAVVANPTIKQKVQESGVDLCLRAKRTAGAYLVRLLRWSVA